MPRKLVTEQSHDVVWEEYQFLTSQGVPEQVIAQRLGLKLDTMQKIVAERRKAQA